MSSTSFNYVLIVCGVGDMRSFIKKLLPRARGYFENFRPP